MRERSGDRFTRAGRDTRRKRGVRLFVAAYPPAALVTSLKARVARLELPPHRWTPDAQVHLTLHFIGDTPEREIDDVLESVERATGGVPAMELTVTALIPLPTHGPARLIAATTDAPAPLLELQRRLVERLARKPRERPGARYLPHLTLCRFRTPSRIRLPDDVLATDPLDLEAARATDQLESPEFPVTEVRVMKSKLGSDGARHDCIGAFTLQG